MFINRLSLAAAALGSMAVLPSCGTATYHARQSTFLQHPDRLQSNESLPFQHSWRAPNLNWSRYDAITVPSVTLAHLQYDKREEHDGERWTRWKASARELADYTQKRFRNLLTRAHSNPIKMVSHSSNRPRELSYEIALIEFTPTRPLMNTAATACSLTGSLVQQALLNAGGALAKSGTRGRLTLELQVRDTQSGQIIFMMSDSESGRPSIVNIKDFQQLGHAKAEIDAWAQQMLEVVHTNTAGESVRDRFPVELKPW